MKPSSRIVSPLVRAILGAVCRVDAAELERIPRKGPLIVVVNHINFLESPLIYTHLYPRNVASVVKRQTWDNPFIGFLANVWEAIPLDREGTDLQAMRRIQEALAAGRIVALAPEGTRSGHGRLQRGREGIVPIALKSGAPIVPVAHFGGERFWDNLKSFRRTRFAFRVGEPFRLRAPEGALTRGARREMADEIMNRLSILLPRKYRGFYPDPEGAPTRHLDFLGGTA